MCDGVDENGANDVADVWMNGTPAPPNGPCGTFRATGGRAGFRTRVPFVGREPSSGDSRRDEVTK